MNDEIEITFLCECGNKLYDHQVICDECFFELYISIVLLEA